MPVPVPFARRRGVQVVAAFVAGLLAFWGGIWLTNGLREQDRAEQQTAQELRRRRSGTDWQNLVETEVGKIGSIEPGAVAVILPQVRGAIDQLGSSNPPKGAKATLRDAARDARQVVENLSNYELSRTLAGRGFDKAEVLRFLAARDELVLATDLYREASLLGALAASLEGDARVTALDRAKSLLAKADAAVARFQTNHTEALTAAGVLELPREPAIPGLPGS